MKKALLLVACLAGAACSPYRSKEPPRTSFRLRNAPGLTVQWYWVGIMGNLTAAYLTDSATFRRYLGTFDDESQVIAVQVHGDRVVAEKSDNGRHAAEPRPVHQTMYSLRQLRHEQAFN